MRKRYHFEVFYLDVWQWRFVAPDGEVLARSFHSYVTRSSCLAAVRRAKRYFATARVWR